ncbi:hypothetical protein [Bacillus horti]|uniref:Lipoprotein n=1 Tax=Caldalkalibacillus horti TaxID=77523 RepID=A0ABT9VWK5_9BACI|nr:hypothetical protein [Bacillus horti]MDQ0165259.1 hypothetical protein [Bacillus horti]
MRKGYTKLYIIFAIGSILLLLSGCLEDAGLGEGMATENEREDHLEAQIERIERELEQKNEQLAEYESHGTEEQGMESPVAELQFHVNFGMESKILVDEITDTGIVYRYYDYQHQAEPGANQEEMTFEELFRDEESGNSDPFPVHILELYLNFGDKQYQLHVSTEFEEAFRKDAQFRQRVANHIGEPISTEFNDIINGNK